MYPRLLKRKESEDDNLENSVANFSFKNFNRRILKKFEVNLES